jgi:hypothetical protein
MRIKRSLSRLKRQYVDDEWRGASLAVHVANDTICLCHAKWDKMLNFVGQRGTQVPATDRGVDTQNIPKK